MKLGEFKSDRARERFLAVYQETLDAVWPGPRVALDVPTRFGSTRVHRSGPPAADPVVLLPAAGGNALMWHQYVETLSRHRTVIAVDPVGEAGASVQTAPIADGADLAAWLEDLLAGLDVSAAHVVGASYGGWIALHHQVRHPGRVAGLTLVDPAGLAKAGGRFYRWLILGAMAGLAPRGMRRRLAKPLRNSALLDDQLMRLLKASVGFRRRLPLAPPLTDAELREVRVPALFLIGGKSALNPAEAVAGRVREILPGARVEIVPGAGHALVTDAPETVAERVLAGLGERI